jgi:hypothetical protein
MLLLTAWLAIMLESMVSAAAPAQPVADDAVVVLASGIDEVNVEKRPYSSYVAECLDLLMSHGTDRYGKVQKPLLVTRPRASWSGCGCPCRHPVSAYPTRP